MVAIVFPTNHFPGVVAQEGAGRLLNCYSEPIGEGGRAIAVRHRVPGLLNFGTTVRSGPRSMIEINGILYVAMDSRLVKLSSGGGAATDIGVLNGDRKGFFARNNATTPDKVFVDPDGNIAVFTDSTVTNAYPDGDLPAVNSVATLNGYFLFTTGLGRIWASDLNSTAINALSFTTAESNPDGLLRGVTWADQYYACGSKTIEVFSDQGLSPFPLARVTVIARGIAGPYCVTGHEDGFSKGLFIIGDDNCVYQLNGYTPNKVSTPDLDGLIENVADKTTLEMCSYISRGHAFIQISSPTWSWVYNINNQKWHTRPSYLDVRSRISVAYYAFSKWLCGDLKTGNVQQITSSSYKEIDDPLICEAWSASVQAFPRGISAGPAFFDFAMGVGNSEGEDPIETDPSVEISYSTDGGRSFSIPRVRKLGFQADGRFRVRVNQVKAAGSQGYIWKVRQSDPVHFGLIGGEMTAEARAA